MKWAIVLLALAAFTGDAARDDGIAQEAAQKDLKDEEFEETANKAEEVKEQKKLQEANAATRVDSKEMMTVDEDASVEVQGGPPIWQEWIDGNFDAKLALNNGYTLANSAPVTGVGKFFGNLPTGASSMSPLPNINFKINLECQDPPKEGAWNASLYMISSQDRKFPSTDLFARTFTESLGGRLIESMHGLRGPNIDIYYDDETGNVVTREITTPPKAFTLEESILPCESLSINVDLGIARDAADVWTNQGTFSQNAAKLKEHMASKGGIGISGTYNLASGIVRVPQFPLYKKQKLAFELTQTCSNYQGENREEGKEYPFCYPGKKVMLVLKLTKTDYHINGFQVAIYLRKE